MITKRFTWALAALLTLAGLASPAKADLDAYLKKPDTSFAWSLASSKTVGDVTVHQIKMTSQVWQGIPWTHNISIIVPPDIAFPDAALLFISGGSVGDEPRDKDLSVGFAIAKACRARVVVLPQVPNQPLLGGKKEDALIVETFMRYLETKDGDWPLLFPMVKSAIRAMDAAQAFAEEQKTPITRFVVSGASKRGWTTWLTGASDPRVKAIAPMVIPTLKLEAQGKHQLENFGGQYSEQIKDYTDRKILGGANPEATKLLAMVDPITYRDRLSLPKLQINGTNDPYWTLDSMNLYWDDLIGPKWVVYLPNAGHGLDQHREYAINGVGALFRHVMSNTPFPEISWKFTEETGDVRLDVTSKPAPKSVQIWTATSKTLDFRESPWTSSPLLSQRTMSVSQPKPETGNIGIFADLEYEIDGFSYHLSTQVHQTNRKD